VKESIRHNNFKKMVLMNDFIKKAKNNWITGVYTNNALQAGKEKWCTTCHDDSPAHSSPYGTGVSAPNVILPGNYKW